MSSESVHNPAGALSTSARDAGSLKKLFENGPNVVPGVALMAAIAAVAFALRQLPGISNFSPMILAILLGTAYHNLAGTPQWAKPGIKFCLRRILRFAIILLGLQLTLSQIIQVGQAGLSIILLTMLSTFIFTMWMGRLIGVDRKLTQLIAGGTVICGASAVIATNTVTGAPEEDVAYSVACVTVLGSVAMFVYPLLPTVLNLDHYAYGLWAGASIHEVAQVVAAAFQAGQEAGEFGTIAKLSRVILLAPMIIILGIIATRRARSAGPGHTPDGQKTPLPWFVAGFILLVVVNSVVTIPAAPKSWLIAATPFLLSAALAAMGMETDIRKLMAKGLRPALLGTISFLFIGTVSLLLIKFLT